ncbi:MAG: hypothetical protein KDD36_03995 [Flavobacteriales bacterium]|nr:hypothetical protein [Flavobacteriales bacterium]
MIESCQQAMEECELSLREVMENGGFGSDIDHEKFRKQMQHRFLFVKSRLRKSFKAANHCHQSLITGKNSI